MATIVYERFDASQFTNDMLQEGARLFSSNYGVWNEHAARVMGKFAKPGTVGSQLFQRAVY